MIDTHVNLHHKLFADDLEQTITRANKNGINAMLTICDRMENLKAISNICKSHQNIWYSVGAHPHEAKDHLNLDSNEICYACNDDLAIGIGEAGLDFHYDFSPRDAQLKVFETHIEAAQKAQLPLIVHTRLADDLTGDVLEDAMRECEFPLLMHCYTSSNALMRRMLDIGAFVSISGIATFKNAQDVRDNINDIPDDRLLIETDCPYLAPIPMRGQRNEPSFIQYLLDYLAKFKGMNPNILEQNLDRNFLNLFKKAKLVENV